MTSIKNDVVAKLTIRKNNKLTMTIEIHTNAGHHDFYHWMKRTGWTRKEVRTSNRNDGQRLNSQPLGLEVLAKRFSAGEQIKITILKKRLYKKFLACAAQDLPGYKPVIIHRSDLNSTPASRGILLLTSVRSEIQS